MNEIALEQRPIRRYESPLHVQWKVQDKEKMSELTDVLAKHDRMIAEPFSAFRGGGIVKPNASELDPGYGLFLTSDRGMMVAPVVSEKGGKLTDVVHVPTQKESPIRNDANLAAYKQYVGRFVYEHWDKSQGPPPIPEVTAVDTLPNGQYVTMDRYRPYLRGIGKGNGSMALHVLDAEQISTDETRQLVHVLDAIHPNANEFGAWMESQNVHVPKESLLDKDNPMMALRGQEWWVNPSAPADRLRELTVKAKALEKEFTAIDPTFKAEPALTQFIQNNLSILPHQNGTVDSSDVADHLRVVHGALYPGNINRSDTADRTKKYFTITGGDRSHIGLAGESIDWLVASAAASPAHQEALISEFMKLHPDDTDKRGLAMHVLYRALSESTWHASHSPASDVRNLAKLSYDILSGNGVWSGVNTPAKKAA
jgi:hypothetical protein